MRLMQMFVYKAYDRAGVAKEDEISAVSLDSARFKLKELGLVPVRITPKSDLEKWQIIKFERNFSLNDVEFATSKISILLKNGIKIDKALDITQSGIANSKLKRIIKTVGDDIRKGESLSSALEKHQNAFDPLFISVVRIGEATGRLSEAFSDISRRLAFQREIRSKTLQALIYPLIILMVCVGSIFFVFNFIVPKFSMIFAGIDRIPVYTQILLSISGFFQKYQFAMLAGCLVLAVVSVRAKNRIWLKRRLDKIVLHLPLVKGLCTILESLRFTSALAMMLKSGVVISDALEYAIRAVGNQTLRQKLAVVKNEVRHGGKLSESMNKAGFLPDTFDGLLEIGEQTGRLGTIFEEMEARLKTDYENQVTTLITVVEPALIILMGLIVGSVVVVMLLSMVSINDIAL